MRIDKNTVFTLIDREGMNFELVVTEIAWETLQFI